jgi:hypothetical protein
MFLDSFPMWRRNNRLDFLPDNTDTEASIVLKRLTAPFPGSLPVYVRFSKLQGNSSSDDDYEPSDDSDASERRNSPPASSSIRDLSLLEYLAPFDNENEALNELEKLRNKRGYSPEVKYAALRFFFARNGLGASGPSQQELIDMIRTALGQPKLNYSTVFRWAKAYQEEGPSSLAMKSKGALLASSKSNAPIEL